MKKTTRLLALLLLAALLLGGCAGGGAPAGLARANTGKAVSAPAPEDRGGLPPVSFGEMPYSRPDLETLREAVDAVGRALDRGESLGTVTDALDRCYDAYYEYYTMYNLADIRSCQDTGDAFYAQEYAWCSEHYATVQQLMEALYRRCARSDLGRELERRYFWAGFVSQYSGEGETLSDEAVELMRRESALIAEYRALTANPTILLDGQERDYAQCLQELEGPALDEAVRSYYEQYNEDFARIYIDLVRVRQAQARALGYDSYEQMQYAYSYERDYSPAQAAAYLEEIKSWLVPLYTRLRETDIYARLDYGSLSEDRLLLCLGAAAEALGGPVEEAFRFMTSYELYDVRVDPRKAAISFEAYLSQYEAPYVFLDAYGDLEDLTGFAHEFGHYVDAYVNYDAYETVDVSECFSQSMELLMLPRFGAVLSPEEQEQLTELKLLDLAELYVQQASFAEFESRVYARDPETLSADFLNALSLELAKDYGYYDGVSEAYYAMSWVDILHFFEMPFYVITYPVTCDCAMQLYELERERPGAGVEKYLELLPRQYEGLLDTLSACGLESPFAPGRLEQAAETLGAALG